jgi:hypothetical protein
MGRRERAVVDPVLRRVAGPTIPSRDLTARGARNAIGGGGLSGQLTGPGCGPLGGLAEAVEWRALVAYPRRTDVGLSVSPAVTVNRWLLRVATMATPWLLVKVCMYPSVIVA